MELKIRKCCSICNSDFELKNVEHNENAQQTVTTFENCPHCGARNDTWIVIKWPKSKGD